MKFLFFLTIGFLLINPCLSQTNTINYLKENDTSFVFTRKTFNNWILESISILNYKKSKVTFYYDSLNVYYITLLANSPISDNEGLSIYYSTFDVSNYKDIEDEINKNIDPKKMPKYEYSNLFFLIISKDGILLDAGVIWKEDEILNNEVLTAIKKIKHWIPSKYYGFNVNSLVYLRFRYHLK
ncbi:MAG: hypothetical protein U0W24_23110 [Bacteroidales bacterium]